jgi:hypothetical protein
VVAVAVLVIAGLVAGWLWLQREGARQPERRLRSICLGDQAQVESLIQSEVSRAPGISRAEAASRAVQRYERDNR